MRIIFVPQYPVPNRYPEWWFLKFPEEFKKAGFEVVVIGERYAKLMELDRGNEENFSPIRKAINFELEQIYEYAAMELMDDDILFLADLSFPGLFCNALYHQKPKKMYAFCHATSLNKFDYFEKDRTSKFAVESAHSILFNKIFVGSDYHVRKLGWKNTINVSLPGPTHLKQFKTSPKTVSIASASRPGRQKVDAELEANVEGKFGPVYRKHTETAEEYYEFLGNSKVLLITSHEDTFGYQIVDAINNNCIPIARNSLSYPELLPREYLYDNEDELFMILDQALQGKMDVPELICAEKMKNFYRTIIKEMTEEDHPF